MPEHTLGRSFPIIHYAPHEWYSALDRQDEIREIERQLRLHGHNPRNTVIAAPEYGIDVVRQLSFGRQEIIQGVVWAALGPRQNEDAGSCILDMAFREVEFTGGATMVVAALDAGSLEPAGTAVHTPVNKINYWQALPGQTLDTAARLVFAIKTA